MNNSQIISTNPFTADSFLAKSPAGSAYMWKNLVEEKQPLIKRQFRLQKGGFLHDFWLLISSPIS